MNHSFPRYNLDLVKINIQPGNNCIYDIHIHSNIININNSNFRKLERLNVNSMVSDLL